VPLQRRLLIYALITGALAVLFVVFISFKRDTALMEALSAAGQVAAAGFAAIAAVGAMRAAAESSASARRSREALVRTARPRLHLSVGREDGMLVGRVRCEDPYAAVDVTIVWILAERESVVGQAARLDPARPDSPPGTGLLTVDLGLPETASVEDEVRMVWIEYRDDSHLGRWRDTWQVTPDTAGQGILHQAYSQLVD
jgi:hypothetical protein